MGSMGQKFVLWIMLCLLACDPAPPVSRVEGVRNPREDHNGWVTDESGTLNPNTVAEIEQYLSALNRDTGAEVALVVLPSIGTEEPRDFATRLFNHWHIGRRDYDDGVLLLHVLDQRRVEIETGYGLEGSLPDVVCSRILHGAVIPSLKRGDFDAAHLALVTQIDAALRNPPDGEAPKPFRATSRRTATANHKAESTAESVARVSFLLLILTWAGGMVAAIVRIARRVRRARTSPADAAEVSTARRIYDVYDSLGAKLLASLTFPAGALAPSLLLDLGVMRPWFGSLILLACVAALFGLWRENVLLHPHPRYRRVAGLIAAAALTLGTLVWWGRALTLDAPKEYLLFARGGMALCCALIAWAYLHHKVRKARLARRPCSTCGAEMRRLSEDEEDATLVSGQRAEEDVGSYDYDVWLCDQNHSLLERYPGPGRAEICAGCNYRTYRHSQTHLLRAPTYTEEGEQALVYSCLHCGHAETVHRTLPRRTTSSSSGSSGGGTSGGGSSGGGSFGGGSSGGGGAGASYRVALRR